MQALPLLILATVAKAPRPADDLSVFDGTWVFVEDKTEGRALEQLGPPMSSTFSMRSDAGAMVLVSGHGSGLKDVRVTLDGTVKEVPSTAQDQAVLYKAGWKDGTLWYETEYIRQKGGTPEGKIRKEFRHTSEGLLVSVITRFSPEPSIGLYRHPEDIAMPTPFKAKIDGVAWMAGAWTGTRGTAGTTTIEERWSPPKGGSMLAISRTVSRDRLSAFEFLRVLERDGGLVYIAQPNGGTATEFILTDLTATKAVFDNPRHEYPKRITYELTGEGGLTATIGQLKGGTPRKFEYKRGAK